MEGITLEGPSGEILRARQLWENKDFKVWTFKIREDAKMVQRRPGSPHRTSFTAGAARLIRNTRITVCQLSPVCSVVNIDDVIAGEEKAGRAGHQSAG